VRWLGEHAPQLPATRLTLLYLAALQATLVAFTALRALRNLRLLSGRALTPGAVLTLSFALLVLAGMLLLKTPHSTPDGIRWVDALFTATSAVCVTGLTVVDTAAGFTSHGQMILLGLIQLGGLGMMTLTYFFAFYFAGGVSIRNRIGLQSLLSEESLTQVGTVLGLIVGFTLALEAAGAVAIWMALPPGTVEDPVFFAVFHAISAFCNAGFSTLGEGLADPRLHGRMGLLSVVMVLVVIGGIGFPVLKNLWEVGLATVRVRFGWRLAHPPRLTANSRIVLATTGILLGGGAVAVYATEFIWADGVSNGPQWFSALFLSVTARTAGFHLTPTGALLPATAIVLMLLMFVGGSPSGTAGGIKTSTLAVAVLSLRRVLFGRAEIEAFGRRLPAEVADRALAVLLLAIGYTTLVATVLCILHPELPPFDLAFEAVSAVATVGLSRGVTAQLGDGAKLVLVAAMFVGRIGVLAFLLGFVRRREPTGYRLPEAQVVIT
jgi:trk system potassium uptake protein TrkH